MRAILVILGLAVLVLVAMMAFGMISLQQTEGGSLPRVNVEGGKAPEFKADVGNVRLGTKEKTVEVPTLQVQKAEGSNQQANQQ
ncbi:hypothetical protein KY084_08800 [Stakelama sp. CBK3Z-3]|uniref:Uncharacterized protein n=1 Tax=Stakelama flava TaxID=2860338 RepID=A0ABS6XLB4_9SPHN|nr:hypothetical protein [Stakelama flava]